MEGRGPTEGNRQESRIPRTLCRMRWFPWALAPIRRRGLQVVHVVPFCTSPPEAGAQCGHSARWDLCGGQAERPVPTATIHNSFGSYRIYRSRVVFHQCLYLFATLQTLVISTAGRNLGMIAGNISHSVRNDRTLHE